jgi:general secretion pathway protein K
MKIGIDVVSSRSTGGFVVVAVLWIIGALSALVSVYAIYVIDTAAGFSIHEERVRAEALVLSGLELAAYHLATPVSARPTNGNFNFRVDNDDVSIEYRSEAARVDLNAAPKELLMGLFVTLGLRRDAAEDYVDRIVRWRTTTLKQDADSAAQAPPPDAQATSPVPASRAGRFTHAYEISLVTDLPRSFIERLLPFITVYSGRPQVNILDAAPEVISALPGIAPERLVAILAERQGRPPNQQVLASLLGPASAYASLEAGNTLRVKSRITFESGRQAEAEVVILLFERGDEPYAILSWRDGEDASRARPIIQSRSK